MTVTLTPELEKFMAVGMEQIRSGEVIDGRAAIENIRQKLRQRERDGK